MTGYQTDHEHFVDMADGREVRAFPKDWIVTNSHGQIVDVISPKQFEGQYDVLTEGQLTITPDQRTRLGRMLGVDSVVDSEHLVTAVSRLATLKIGDITVTFTPQQWEELSRRATKLGLATSIFMQRLVDRFLQDIWTL